MTGREIAARSAETLFGFATSTYFTVAAMDKGSQIIDCRVAEESLRLEIPDCSEALGNQFLIFGAGAIVTGLATIVDSVRFARDFEKHKRNLRNNSSPGDSI